MISQAEIDRQNSAFWDELCGTQLAVSLGIHDDSPESLAKFDSWYFDFYPYLFKHIPFAQMAGKRVLEVGLGYGSVAEKIAASGALYHGLDIAAGPVAMVAKRLERLGVTVELRQDSILEPPFEEGTFDWIIAIGCLHHTGNLQAAIDQVHGLLRPGGQAMIMVYSATSYRQWVQQPAETFRRMTSNPAGYAARLASDESTRGAYDANEAGEAAPQTEFVTKRELRYMCRAFKTCAIASENIWTEGGPLEFLPRNLACLLFRRYLGLDLYCRLER